MRGYTQLSCDLQNHLKKGEKLHKMFYYSHYPMSSTHNEKASRPYKFLLLLREHAPPMDEREVIGIKVSTSKSESVGSVLENG